METDPIQFMSNQCPLVYKTNTQTTEFFISENMSETVSSGLQMAK